MRDILIDLNNLATDLYTTAIIRQGEHNASQIIVTLSDEFIGHTNNIVFRLNNEAPYIASNVPNVANVITYPIPNSVTYQAGVLKVEIQAYDTTTMLTKSVTVSLKVQRAIGGVPETIPPTLYGLEGSISPTPNTFLVRDTMGQGELTTIDFPLTPLVTYPTLNPLKTGRLMWDETYKTLMFGLDGNYITHQVGQEFNVYARNASGLPMARGNVVAISGTTGEIPTMIMADADGTSIQNHVIGIVFSPTLANQANGYVVTQGMLHNIDTLAWNEGDQLWLSSTAGQLTNVMPSPPAVPVFMGWVVKRAGLGKIYVSIYRHQLASEVPILDTANNYTSTNVEGALLEIANKLKAHGITMP